MTFDPRKQTFILKNLPAQNSSCRISLQKNTEYGRCETPHRERSGNLGQYDDEWNWKNVTACRDPIISECKQKAERLQTAGFTCRKDPTSDIFTYTYNFHESVLWRVTYQCVHQPTSSNTQETFKHQIKQNMTILSGHRSAAMMLSALCIISVMWWTGNLEEE